SPRTPIPLFFALPLPDALPIFGRPSAARLRPPPDAQRPVENSTAMTNFLEPFAAFCDKQKRGGSSHVPLPNAPAPCSLRRLRLRSQEHTSELQSRENLVCRLLL